MTSSICKFSAKSIHIKFKVYKQKSFNLDIYLYINFINALLLEYFCTFMGGCSILKKT
jgi:hypothetical protein